MTRTLIDVHVIQTLPPSNVNRDDTGSPKSAVYGGVRRARVSSQAWKRAARNAFGEHLDRSELGVRTKRVVEVIAEAVTQQDSSLADQANELAKQVVTAAGIKVAAPRKAANAVEESGYLIFLSARQVQALAALAIDATRKGTTLDKKAAGAVFKADNSIDVALFGRMVADVSDLNVDAAAQVAHAISTHAVNTEFDYFTAVDDRKRDSADEDAGAGMIGTVEFNSSTLYRYATIDLEALTKNLGDGEATVRASVAFVRAFLTSMPTGKQNTFANNTLPDAVLVTLRTDRPISLVGAFEEPVTAVGSGGHVVESIARLSEYAKEVADTYGAPAAAWVCGIGDRVQPLEALGQRVRVADLDDVLGRALRERVSGS
ncbi:MAG: type I-E CRISPR-associated protein Cas7/Cse4/CasC [Kineosporiaceae bacterium]